jgi:hypothetical protein
MSIVRCLLDKRIGYGRAEDKIRRVESFLVQPTSDAGAPVKTTSITGVKHADR